MNYVLFHANCIDGIVSAYTVWKKYGEENWTYIPVKYQEPLPDLINPEIVVITDFSYPRDILLGLSKRSVRVFVIDHHSTAKEELEGLKGEFPFGEIIFDISKCGCVLTHEHCFPDSELPELFLYVQDRNMWNWKLERSKEINEGLRSEILFYLQSRVNFGIIDDLINRWPVVKYELMKIGSVLLDYKQELVNSVVAHVENKQWVIGSYRFKVGIVNCGVYDLVSEVGNTILINDISLHFAMVYTIGNRWVVSLRGMDRKDEYGGDIHVGDIAKKYGGGGHKNAASFKTKEFKINTYHELILIPESLI